MNKIMCKKLKAGEVVHLGVLLSKDELIEIKKRAHNDQQTFNFV